MPDSAAYAERKVVIQNALVIRHLHKMKLIGNLELYFERFCVDANPHTRQLVPSFCDGIPDEDVPINAVSVSSGFSRSVGHPVVIIGCPQFVRVAVLERPADAVNKNGRILLNNRGFALLTRQVGVLGENIFGVNESEFIGQIRIPAVIKLRKQFLDLGFGALDDLPDFLNDFLEELEVSLLFCYG